MESGVSQVVASTNITCDTLGRTSHTGVPRSKASTSFEEFANSVGSHAKGRFTLRGCLRQPYDRSREKLHQGYINASERRASKVARSACGKDTPAWRGAWMSTSTPPGVATRSSALSAHSCFRAAHYYISTRW